MNYRTTFTRIVRNLKTFFAPREAGNEAQLAELLEKYNALIAGNILQVEAREAEAATLEQRMQNLDDQTAQAEIIADGLERLLGRK